MDKKTYSVDELLLYAYKYNKVPAVLFAKDQECRYIYTSEIEDAINGGEEQLLSEKLTWIFNMMKNWESCIMNRIKKL